MTTSSATLFRLRATLLTASLAEATEALLEAWPAPEAGEPLRWRAVDGPWQTTGPVTEPPPGKGVEIEVGAEQGVGALVREPPHVAMQLSLHLSRLDPTAHRAQLDHLVSTMRALTVRGTLDRATITRQDGGQALPEVPLAGATAHAVVATDAAIDEAYDDPERFVASWDVAERIGERWCLTRALDAVDNPAFLRRVMGNHLEMVAAARPGRVAFFPPMFEDGEEEVWGAGIPTVLGVGYDAATGVAELAGHPSDEGRLRPIDLQRVWEIVSAGAVDAGPVGEVRVVFMSESQARRAQPLLRHVGARTAYEDARGETRVLPESA